MRDLSLDRLRAAVAGPDIVPHAARALAASARRAPTDDGAGRPARVGAARMAEAGA